MATEKRVTVGFYYQGNLLNKVREVETSLGRGYQKTIVWQDGMKKSAVMTKGFGVGLQGLSTKLNSVALQFVGLNAIVMGGMRAFQNLNEWIDTSVKQFREFENSMAEVSTILVGDTYGAINGLTAGVERMSIKFGQSATDMSGALYQILSAAVEVQDSLGLLEVATKASIAGLTTVETSVDVLTSIINSYGMEVTQAARVSDTLFQTVVRGKLRFEDLASALGYITPIAASAGVQFEEIAAALSTVTRMGLHVDMATRGLALAIQNVVSPTEQAAEAAKEFDVEMSAVGLRVFGLQGFIEDLNKAIKENGLRVLPRMVRNMRSLRVMIALASDEGLKGFKKDLDLVFNAAGRTDEALSKMIRTQGREAKVVQQSQELIQRKLGETWSPIKRNIEATKLWFATLISTGLNIGQANKQIELLSETLKDNREEIYKSIDAMNDANAIPLFEQLQKVENLNTDTIEEITSSFVDFSKIRDYLTAQKEIAPGTIFGDVSKFEGATSTINNWVSTLENAQGLNRLLGGKIFMNPDTRDQIQGVADTITGMFDDIDDITISLDIGQAIGQLNELGNAVDTSLEDTIDVITNNREEFDKLFGAIDSASKAVFDIQTNILELTSAIEDLSYEVSDTIETLAGFQHIGTLGLEIDTKSLETANSRLSEFATMIKSYGTEFEDLLYEKLAGKTFFMGDEEVSYIDEYDTKLKDAIHTIHQYNEAQKEQAKVSNEVNKIILRNNIRVMEIQLMGMMRRRGQTRQEEKTIKKLQIENAKERLKEEKAELDAKNEMEKNAYEEATETLKAYFDRQSFYLYLMKDNRDSELAHMEQTYKSKQNTLKRYETALDDQYDALERAHEIEVGLMSFIEENLPGVADLYEDVYGVKITGAINSANDAYKEFLKLTKKDSGGEPSSGSGGEPSSGSGGTSTRKSSSSKWTAGPMQASTLLTEKTRKDTSKFDPRKTEIERVNESIFGTTNPLGFKRGSEYIPKDMIVNVHRGETIVPAGKDTGGRDNINISINISGNRINQDTVGKLARQAGKETSQALFNAKNGKSKYRLR